MSELLDRKQHEHGPFERNALIAERLYSILESEADESGATAHFTPEVAWALRMICLKLARSVSHENGLTTGNGDAPLDIVGYAQLLHRAILKQIGGGDREKQESATIPPVADNSAGAA